MRTVIAASLLLLGLTCVAANAVEDPLGRLLKSEDASLCFARDYDAAHLKQHPGQQTQSAMLSFKQDAVRIMLNQKNQKAPIYVVASCSWNPHANLDIHDKRLNKTFTKDAGYDCIVMVSPSSAQEGGSAILDPAADGHAVTLHLEDGATARPSLEKRAKTFDLSLGSEDRVFLMTRTDAAACKAMDDNLEGP